MPYIWRKKNLLAYEKWRNSGVKSIYIRRQMFYNIRYAIDCEEIRKAGYENG